MSFKGIGDNELLYLIRCDNYQAKQLLIERYRIRIYGMIKSFVMKHKLKMVNFDDYYQSCFLTFMKCIKLCDENYNFRNYVKIAIENTLTTIFEQEQIYEEMLSLENDINDRDICSSDQVNDSKVLYLTTEIDDFLSSKLSYLDNKIVQLKMKGYKGIDIALILGINKKEVYKRINKIKDIVNNKFIKI